MHSHDVLAASFKQQGIKHCAAELGLSAPLLYKWCQPSDGGNSGTVNPLDRVAQIVRVTGDPGPLHWLCAAGGGVFVSDPGAGRTAQPALLEQTHRILTEFTELIGAITVGMNDDGKISAGESTRIREEWQQMKSIVESFVRACEQGTYEGADKPAARGPGGRPAG